MGRVSHTNRGEMVMGEGGKSGAIVFMIEGRNGTDMVGEERGSEARMGRGRVLHTRKEKMVTWEG